MQCAICGHYEETNVHALFECPLAEGVWEGTEFSSEIWTSKYRAPVDGFIAVKASLSREELGNFTMVIWELWNARNRFIFGTLDKNIGLLGKRAIAFVRNYHESLGHEEGVRVPLPSLWTPPIPSTYKLNFDGGCVGELGWGWGFVIRNSSGDVVMASV